MSPHVSIEGISDRLRRGYREQPRFGSGEQARKDGHPFDAANTYYRGKWRQCRRCHARRVREARRRKFQRHCAERARH